MANNSKANNHTNGSFSLSESNVTCTFVTYNDSCVGAANDKNWVFLTGSPSKPLDPGGPGWPLLPLGPGPPLRPGRPRSPRSPEMPGHVRHKGETVQKKISLRNATVNQSLLMRKETSCHWEKRKGERDRKNYFPVSEKRETERLKRITAQSTTFYWTQALIKLKTQNKKKWKKATCKNK